MIITDLLAENFRKYTLLHLENLPDKGLIAVNGGNEAGKSSIGDAISFVLFGRTDKLTDERVGKLVRWGEHEVSITLTFCHQDKTYRLVRQADTSGEQSATLYRTDDENILAKGAENVNQAISDLLGYSYSAFVRTFYWSQQIGDGGCADTESLQAMAGVKNYIRLDSELTAEQAQLNNDLEQLRADHQASVTVRDAAGIDQDHLPRLLDVRETLEQRYQGSLALAGNIADIRASYAEKHSNFQRFNQHSRRLGWLASLGIIGLLLALVAWATLTHAPQVVESFWPIAPENVPGILQGLLWSAVAMAVLASLALFYSWHIERNRLHSLRDSSVFMSSAMRDGSTQLNEEMSGFIGARSYDYLVEHDLLENNEESLAWQSNPLHLDSLSERIEGYHADPLETVAAAEGMEMALGRQNNLLERCNQTISTDVMQERTRVDEFMVLHTEVQHNERQLQQREHALKVRKKAQQLVHKAAQHSINKFNVIVHQHCKTLLSDFTQSHYKELEIDNNFALRVLSEEKGDYLDFEEISAGTQRQIALALRVSLANTLAESSDARGQFMFLDEPFAFFDPERTTATINSLYESTAGNLSQIWVTVQDIPEGLDTAFTVDCQRDGGELRVAG